MRVDRAESTRVRTRHASPLVTRPGRGGAALFRAGGEGGRQASVETDILEGGGGGAGGGADGPPHGETGRPRPQAAARGRGLDYCGVLIAGAEVGVATAGTGAARIGVALEPERPVAWAYLARSSRISDWYEELRMILSNWPR